MTQKVALIAGGSSGIGRLAAITLAKSGYYTIINYNKSKEAAEETLDEIRKNGNKAIAISGDVTDYKEMERMFRYIKDTLGRIDVLVHSVGPFIRKRKMFYQMEIDEIEQMISGNFTSAIYTTHFVLPMMRENNFGRIIYFGFNRANEAPAWPDRSVYASSKVALVSFCKTLAVEEAPYGITVNMLCPSDIIGENKEKMIDDVIGMKDKESLRGRPGTGEDITRVIEFLCQGKSDFVTGSIINISGGLDIIHPTSKLYNT